jgi:Tfp pilus assembly protein PilO
VSTYNLALNNSAELQKTRDSLVDTYKNIKEEDRNRLEHFLPNTVNNIKFILEIERIASLHSMPIKNIKFDPQRVQDTKDATPLTNAPTNTNNTLITLADPLDLRPYGTFPVEFTTEGDYNTFVLLMKDIEHNLRLVDIKSVNFAVPVVDPKTGGGLNPNVYTYTLRIETYWLK